jgi:hypothetical protein
VAELPKCSDEHCLMPGVLLLNNEPYCVADYKKRNGGRI